jgi:hypothetical protein
VCGEQSAVVSVGRNKSHVTAERIICINDPYDAPYSNKDNERDLRVHGKVHIPNVYMKFIDPFPSVQTFKTLLYSDSNKGRFQKLICDYLTELAESVDTDIIHSVGSQCKI